MDRGHRTRVNYGTNQMLLPVMVSALVIHASFAHLAFSRLPGLYQAAPLRLDFAPTIGGGQLSALLLTGLLLSEIIEERGNMSVIFSRVNNSKCMMEKI